MYDASFFVEREQYISRIQAYVDENFDDKLNQVFTEVVSFYAKTVDLCRDYETSVDEDEKQYIASHYEEVASLLQKYLDTIVSTMEEHGIEDLEACYQGGFNA